jgi:hypothetical protein
MCTYYRWYNSGFANIAKSRTKLTEQKQSFKCSPGAEGAFQTLKGALRTAPNLAYHQPEQRFVVDTNAGNVGIGEVLSQVQNGRSE